MFVKIACVHCNVINVTFLTVPYKTNVIFLTFEWQNFLQAIYYNKFLKAINLPFQNCKQISSSFNTLLAISGSI